MGKIRLLIVNYIENSLISELFKRDYEVATLNTRTDGHLALPSAVEKFDLIYFAKYYPPTWDDQNILLHRTKTPIIYAFHSPSMIFHPYRLKNYVLNAILLIKLAYMKMARPVNAFHALNTSEYNMIKSLGFRCYYVPLGVDTKLFNKGLRNNRFTIVFVGPRYGKGADMLMKMVPRVLRKASDIKFVLAGKGFLNQYFMSLRSVFRNNIEVCEWLAQKEFAELLSSSHILLFPSRYEAFGLVVLEALSSGMPVFCFNIPGAPKDIVGRYGSGAIAKPFNIGELVDNVLRSYEMWKNEPEEFERLSIACRNVALRYDWSIIANVFDDMFKKVFYEKA